MAKRDCVFAYQDLFHNQPKNLLASCDVQCVGYSQIGQ